MKISLTILGEPASKANQRQLVTFGHGEKKRAALIKSKKALDYERTARMQLRPQHCVMFTGDVRVTLRIYYATRRPDLDESVILDVLQARYTKADGDGERVLTHRGVYANDRQVREKHVYGGLDPRNPRTEIEVEEIEAGLFEQLAPPIPGVAKHKPLVAVQVDPF